MSLVSDSGYDTGREAEEEVDLVSNETLGEESWEEKLELREDLSKEVLEMREEEVSDVVSEEAVDVLLEWMGKEEREGYSSDKEWERGMGKTRDAQRLTCMGWRAVWIGKRRCYVHCFDPTNEVRSMKVALKLSSSMNTLVKDVSHLLFKEETI